MESEQDVESHCKQRQSYSPDSATSDVLGNAWANLFSRYNTYTFVGGAEIFLRHSIEFIFKALEELAHDDVVDIFVARFNHIVGRNSHASVVIDCDNRNGSTFKRRKQLLLQSVGVDTVVELNDIVATTREVDTWIELTSSKRNCNNCNSHSNYDEAHLARADEVEVRVNPKFLGERSAEGGVLEFTAVDEPFEHDARKEYGSEERANNTDNQSCSEALDRTCTVQEQNQTSDDRSEVRVEDSRESILVTIVDSTLEVLTGTKFFLGTFKYEHVGIDSHTESEHNTGDTRESEHSLD